MPRIGADLSNVTDEDMNYSGGWRALEPGDYLMVITDSDFKRTKKGDGWVLWLYVNCIEPGRDKSKWIEFLTIEHPNPEAVRISKAKLKSIGIAVEHPNPDFIEHSEDLHSKPFVANVIQEKASDPKYGDSDGIQNRIVSYHPTDQQDPPPAQDREEPPAHTDYDIPF